MANSDKNILITPNVGASVANPTIRFTGASNTPTTLRVLDDGTVSFEATAGQLFSISDGLSGTIFSVNDISGIPSIEVLDTGLVKLAQYNGRTVIGGSAALVSTSAAMLSIYNSSSNNPGIIVRAAQNHPVTVNIQEWQNSAGTALARIDGSGNSVFQTGYGNFGRFGNWAVSPAGAAIISSTISASNQIGIAIRSADGQSANLQEWQDSTGTVIANMFNSGTFFTTGRIVSGSDYSARFNVAAQNSVGAVIRAGGSQSSDLQQWQNSSGSVLSFISASGQLTVGSSVPLVSTSAAMLSVYQTSSSNAGIIIRSAPGNNGADLFRSENSSGVSSFRIIGNSDIFISGVYVGVYGFAGQAATTTLWPTGTNTIALSVYGRNSQIADLTQWRNGSSSVLSAVNAAGQFTIGSAAPLVSTSAAMVSIYNSSSNTPGLIIRSASLNAVDMQIWQNAAGTSLARITNAGDAKFAALALGNGTIYGNSAWLNIQTTANGQIGALIKGSSGQTSNLQEWQTSAGASVVAIDPLGNITASGNVVYNQSTNAQTAASYTLILSDSGKFVEMNNAGLNFVTIPSNANAAFATGARIDIIQTGAGNTVLSASTGVTLNFYSPTSAATASFAGQWAGVTLVKRATDTWAAIGNIK